MTSHVLSSCLGNQSINQSQDHSERYAPQSINLADAAVLVKLW